MVTVTEELPHSGMQRLELELIDKLFKCIKCGENHRFYTYSGRVCSKCGISLPPIDKMLESESQRRMYHFDNSGNLIEKFMNIT